MTFRFSIVLMKNLIEAILHLWTKSVWLAGWKKLGTTLVTNTYVYWNTAGFFFFNGWSTKRTTNDVTMNISEWNDKCKKGIDRCHAFGYVSDDWLHLMRHLIEAIRGSLNYVMVGKRLLFFISTTVNHHIGFCWEYSLDGPNNTAELNVHPTGFWKQKYIVECIRFVWDFTLSNAYRDCFVL